MGERRVAPNAPQLVLETANVSTVLSPSRSYHVGRDPVSEIVLADPRVSWHHALLHVDHGHWALDDVGSTNGTYVEGRRVGHLDVGPGSVIRFGNPGDGPRVALSGAPEPAPRRPPRPSALTSLTGSYRRPTTVRPLPARTVRIGRAPDNDLVLDDLSVSRRHAELRALPDGRYEIADLGSHNGTYVNGQSQTAAAVGPQDLVGIGHSVFCLVGGELQEFVDTGDVTLARLRAWWSRSGRQTVLLDRITFPVGEKCAARGQSAPPAPASPRC